MVGTSWAAGGAGSVRSAAGSAFRTGTSEPAPLPVPGLRSVGSFPRAAWTRRPFAPEPRVDLLPTSVPGWPRGRGPGGRRRRLVLPRRPPKGAREAGAQLCQGWPGDCPAPRLWGGDRSWERAPSFVCCCARVKSAARLHANFGKGVNLTG